MKRILGLSHDIVNKLALVKVKLQQSQKYGTEIDIPLVLQAIDDAAHYVREQQKHAKENIHQLYNQILIKDRYEKITAILPSIEKELGIAITTCIEQASDDCTVYCDEQLADHIIRNMLGNAAKAEATKVDIIYVEKDMTVEVLFRDNGKGMTEDEIDKLGFGFTTNGDGHGEGIRSIKRLVVEAGGDLERPKSIPGIGTEFKIIIQKVQKVEKQRQ